MSVSVVPFQNFVPESHEVANDPTRPYLLSSVLYPLLGEHRSALQEFAQIDQMSEDRFADWLKTRKVPVFGSVFDSDLGEFWRRGWLRADSAEVVNKGRRRMRPASGDDRLRSVKAYV